MQYVVVLSGETQDFGYGLARRHSVHVPYKAANVNSSRGMGQVNTVVQCFDEDEQNRCEGFRVPSQVGDVSLAFKSRAYLQKNQRLECSWRSKNQ